MAKQKSTKKVIKKPVAQPNDTQAECQKKHQGEAGECRDGVFYPATGTKITS